MPYPKEGRRNQHCNTSHASNHDICRHLVLACLHRVSFSTDHFLHAARCKVRVWTNIFSRACSGMDRDKMAVVQEFHWSDRNFFHRLLLLRRVAFLVSSTAGDVNTNFFYDDPKRRRPGTWNRYSSSPDVGNLRLVVYASQFDNPSNTTKKK